MRSAIILLAPITPGGTGRGVKGGEVGDLDPRVLETLALLACAPQDGDLRAPQMETLRRSLRAQSSWGGEEGLSGAVIGLRDLWGHKIATRTPCLTITKI